MTDITNNEVLNMNSTLYTTLGLIPASDMSGILQVSTQTLATWRCKKKGPPSIKLGKRVFYLLAEFNRWMQEEVRTQRSVAKQPRKQERKQERKFDTQLDIESYLQG